MHTDEYPIFAATLLCVAVIAALGFYAGYVAHSYSDDCRIVVSGEGAAL